MSKRWLLGLMLVGLGCGSVETPVVIADHCNPLGATGCAFPWPSSAYLADDASTVTGYRLELPQDALPLSVRGDATDPAHWNRFDGFPVGGVILASFPGGVSGDTLPTHANASEYLGDDAPVLVVNLSTNERVPIFAEADLNADLEHNQALLIHPLERLRPATRYAVIIRNTVTAADGSKLDRSPGFQTLRRSGSMDHPLFERVRAHHASVMAAAQAHNVAEAEVVTAWDFVTASDESVTADLRAMQQQAIAELEANGDAVGYTLQQRNADPAIVWRRYDGTFAVPNFLDTTSGSLDLYRGADGLPALNGTRQASISIVVPACVQFVVLPIPVVVFGHGLFGSGSAYLDEKRLQEVANDKCFLLMATDFTGLSEQDILHVLAVANDFNQAPQVADKLSQSVVNFIALEYLVRGPLSSDSDLNYIALNTIDVNQVYYFGASLGGIMGGVFMSYDNHIPRGVLGVPGGSWTLLLERSYAWGQLESTIKGSYETDEAYQLGIALLGSTMERVDPLTTAHNVIDDPIEGAIAKRLLLYEAVGDSLVANVATETFARSLGIPSLEPASVYTPFGMAEAASPANALVVYDEGVSNGTEGLTNQPPSNDNGTHGGINERQAVLDQIAEFLLNGTIINTCNGAACDCTTGACD